MLLVLHAVAAAAVLRAIVIPTAVQVVTAVPVQVQVLAAAAA